MGYVEPDLQSRLASGTSSPNRSERYGLVNQLRTTGDRQVPNLFSYGRCGGIVTHSLDYDKLTTCHP